MPAAIGAERGKALGERPLDRPARGGLAAIRVRGRAASFALLLATLPAAPALGDPVPAGRPCADLPRVAVQGGSPTDAVTVCEGAGRAIAFLGRAGLQLPGSTTFEIVETLPPELDGRALGCYLRGARRTLVLSYARFEALGTWFRVPADREMYRGVAAHEMAHAMVGCQPGGPQASVAAHEYVAYVTLLGTLAPATRRRVLARFEGRGFESVLQINDLVHAVDPQQFGVDAWRHYLRRADRAGWLRDVVAGGIVPILPSEAP